ncbi:MAG TPA: alpha/beta hydrolase [Micromonosporaceae bacterium]|jgi:pimeloyl-ACP methyl ester carboxylesterase|nr:alpha/beta hydrolase [Micromonosporaceae bacterium]
MRISVRGLTFDVSVEGPTDGPAVLLLHGFPQNATEWQRVLPALHAAGLQTVAPNQRGYSPGARPAEPEAYEMKECVADAVALLDELGFEQAHIVGHDWGAAVAWRLAAEYPHRVQTLTAVSVPHTNAFGAALASDDDQKQRSSYMTLFRQPGHAEDVLLADDGARLRAMFGGCPSELVPDYVEPMLDRSALTAALNWYRAMSRDSLACPDVTVPTTYVWGDNDLAVGPTAARGCARHVSADYRFVALTGVSHWIPDEVPGAMADAILARIED